jgi:hypothetical protein
LYIIILVVAVVAIALVFYSFMAKPSQEIKRIVWRRSGGFAGLDDTVTIESDGSVALSSSFLGEAEFSLSGSEWEALRALVEVSDFMELNAIYRAKSDVADYFSYELTVETDSTSKRVQWVDEWALEGDLPEGLMDIGDQILIIIHGTGTGAVEGVVSDDGGSPLPGLAVSIIRGSVGFPEISAITGEDGSYNIGSVPPGVFALGVHDGSGAKLAEDTVFVRGGEISGLDFVVTRASVQLIEVGFSDELGSPHDVFVSGNYAYIADSFNGLRVVNVSDPANPQQVGSFDPPGSRRAQGVYFSDPYLYVADGLGLLILDVSDPTAPFEVGFYHPPGFAVKVYPLGGYAFVADREGGLRIANVSDPANPKHVSNYFEAGSVHVLDVFVSGSYAYVAMGGLGLRIVDISDPANPQEVGFSDTEGVAEAVQVSGSYAYLADGEDGLRIFDISDPADPQEIGFYDTPAPGYAKDVYLSGRYAFMGDGPSSRLLVIDVSDPANPELAGEYETPGYVWAIYITDSHAYVANGEHGMLILLLSIE